MVDEKELPEIEMDLVGNQDNEDLDALLDSIGADMTLPVVPAKEEDSAEEGEPILQTIDAGFDKESEQIVEPEVEMAPTPSGEISSQVFPQAQQNSSEQIFKEKHTLNLQWYSGDIREKAYELSLSNMPEFLDEDNEVKIIHINIESSYGWNVFFDNGVFMNLVDLVEYQERNGKIPCPSGKVIYGNKTTTFEKIERIVVYEKPHYFAYEVR